MNRVRIGDVEVTALLDMDVAIPVQFMLPEYAEAYRAEAATLGLDPAVLPASISSFLVRSDGKTILVDSGMGPRDRGTGRVGRLDAALREIEVRPEEIDAVIHTHLHIDHVGWNTVPADEPGGSRVFFSSAQFVIQQSEWDYWMRPELYELPENRHLVDCVLPLKDTGRIAFFEGEKAYDSNITFISTPGHTPGHVSIGIYSQGERAVISGDVSHHPIQLDHPDWSPTVDSDRALSATTRDRLFDAAADDGRLWIGTHWPHPGFGRIVRLEGKRVFRAL